LEHVNPEPGGYRAETEGEMSELILLKKRIAWDVPHGDTETGAAVAASAMADGKINRDEAMQLVCDSLDQDYREQWPIAALGYASRLLGAALDLEEEARGPFQELPCEPQTW
jgi:hypothetical protein